MWQTSHLNSIQLFCLKALEKILHFNFDIGRLTKSKQLDVILAGTIDQLSTQLNTTQLSEE